MADLAPPADSRGRLLYSGLLLCGLFGVFCVGLVKPDLLYIWIGPIYMPPLHPYLDLHCILAHADGYALGWDVKRMASNPLDVIGRGHPAVSVWWFQIFVFLGWGREDLIWLGTVVTLVFLLVVVGVVKAERPIEFLVALMALFSPSTVMALERSNVDVMVFLLLALLPLLAAQRAFLGFTVLTGFATGLKYYPVMAVGAVLGSRGAASAKWGVIGLLVLFAAGYVWVYWMDLTATAGSVASPFTYYTFGFDTVFRLYNVPDGVLTGIKVLSMAGGGALVLFLSLREKTLSLPATDKGVAEGYLLGAGITIFSFYALLSFEYRLIFFLFCLPLLFQWLSRGSGFYRMLSGITLALYLFLLYAEHIWLLRVTDFRTMTLTIPTDGQIPRLKHTLFQVWIWLLVWIYALCAAPGLKDLLVTLKKRGSNAS